MPLTEAQLEILFKPPQPRPRRQARAEVLLLGALACTGPPVANLRPDRLGQGGQLRARVRDRPQWHRWDAAYLAKCRPRPSGTLMAASSACMRTRPSDRPSISPAAPTPTIWPSSRPDPTPSSAPPRTSATSSASVLQRRLYASALGSSLAHPDIKPKAGEWVWQDRLKS
jgi:hypothetical protein